ncbi:hypothetical protein BH10CYA1_BH10CYA1_26920 [soil metagenome]
MIRSFCVGAIAGFLFGSTKKGQDVREGLDGFLTELTSSDAMKTLDEKRSELSDMASNAFSKFANGESEKPAAKEKTAEQNFEPASEEKEDEMEVSSTARELDADKAQELADKLGAKPSAPIDENLAAFAHHDDEAKSA